MNTFKRIFSMMLVATLATTLVLTSCKNEKTDDKGDAKADTTKTATTPPAPVKSEAETRAEAEPKTTVEFEKTKLDHGKMKEGEKAEFVFKFKNTGDKPLIITDAKGSCGCTVPDWPKEPVAPGASGEIKAVFNSQGKSGPQTKQVTVTSNTEPIKNVLTITAEVEKDPNAKPAEANAGQPQINVAPSATPAPAHK